MITELMQWLPETCSILWAMVDIWPNSDFSWNIELFRQPFLDLFLAIAIALGLALLLSRILPHTSIWNQLILAETVGNLSRPKTNSTDSKEKIKTRMKEIIFLRKKQVIKVIL